VIRAGEKVFVDTGAWLALALTHDPYNERAKKAQAELEAAGARLVVSVPVVIETFTFLQRRYAEAVALSWRDRLRDVDRLELVDCTPSDLRAAWAYLDRKDLHRLSLVDATSFTLMARHRLRAAFTFDTHFAEAGFRCVG
jgi:predicted nucleic acid-binding protein